MRRSRRLTLPVLLAAFAVTLGHRAPAALAAACADYPNQAAAHTRDADRYGVY